VLTSNFHGMQDLASHACPPLFVAGTAAGTDHKDKSRLRPLPVEQVDRKQISGLRNDHLGGDCGDLQRGRQAHNAVRSRPTSMQTHSVRATAIQ
jgi:hypothetical protein